MLLSARSAKYQQRVGVPIVFIEISTMNRGRCGSHYEIASSRSSQLHMPIPSMLCPIS